MSDWYQLENNHLAVQFTTKGAEIKRLFAKHWSRELLWQPSDEAGKALWNRSAPILFPVVGKLKNDRYTFQGKEYSMPQHGFARDKEFECVECLEESITFKLEADQESFTQYPFLFELFVRYDLREQSLITNYVVKNVDRQTIYFSIGAHPGFGIREIDHLEIHFEQLEKGFFRLKDGAVDWSTRFSFETEQIKPSKQLFLEDALIFKDLKSKYVDIVDIRHHGTMRLHKGDAPFFGVWGKGEVPFICLEPWWGVADDLEHDGQLENKRGIMTLSEGRSKTFSYKIELV